jgi:MFS family permease
MIAGLVVAGFGLASVYIAPLANFLIAKFGLSQAMMIFGVSFIIAVCALAMLLVNPPEGYTPVETKKPKVTSLKAAAKTADFPPSEIMKTKAFYQLWFMFFVPPVPALSSSEVWREWPRQAWVPWPGLSWP